MSLLPFGRLAALERIISTYYWVCVRSSRLPGNKFRFSLSFGCQRSHLLPRKIKILHKHQQLCKYNGRGLASQRPSIILLNNNFSPFAAVVVRAPRCASASEWCCCPHAKQQYLTLSLFVLLSPPSATGCNYSNSAYITARRSQRAAVCARGGRRWCACAASACQQCVTVCAAPLIYTQATMNRDATLASPRSRV